MGTTVGIVAIIVGAITVLTSLGKLMVASYRFFRRLDKSIEYIESEMRHNGGSTIRDHIVKTTLSLKDTTDTIKTISGRLDRLEASYGRTQSDP